MPRESLGAFEQMVLLALLHLGDRTYAVPIVREIEKRTGRETSRAAVFVAIQRLEKKGLIRTWLDSPGQPERGGRPRRYVAIEPAGLKMLRQACRSLRSMWSGLEAILEQSS